MSQENVEIVRRCNDFWVNRDWSVVPELVDPDIEIDLTRNIFNPDTYHGHAGVKRWVQAVDEAWDDFRVVATELIDADNQVVSAIVMYGTGKESGVEVKMPLFQVWTLRNSKVIRAVGGYRDRSEALEAVGLSEQDAQSS